MLRDGAHLSLRIRAQKKTKGGYTLWRVQYVEGTFEMWRGLFVYATKPQNVQAKSSEDIDIWMVDFCFT